MTFLNIATVGQILFLLLLIPRCSILTNARYRNHQLPAYSLERPRMSDRVAVWPDQAIASYPSFVGLRGVDTKHFREVSYCGGVLIGSDLVLTAGQCFIEDFKNFEISAAPSIYHPDLWEEKDVETYRVIKACRSDNYAMLEGYDYPAFDYQILRLERPILGINETLLAKTLVNRGLRASGPGIGLVSESKEKPQVAQEFLALVDKCRGKGKNRSNICFQGVDSITCSGDEGSPIFYKDDKNQAILIGIASTGSRNCRVAAGKQSVYTDVFKNLRDIKKLALECSS